MNRKTAHVLKLLKQSAKDKLNVYVKIIFTYIFIDLSIYSFFIFC